MTELRFEKNKVFCWAPCTTSRKHERASERAILSDAPSSKEEPFVQLSNGRRVSIGFRAWDLFFPHLFSSQLSKLAWRLRAAIFSSIALFWREWMPCVNITDNADCRVSVQGQCIFDEPKKASNASSEATEELLLKSYILSTMKTRMIKR